MVGPPEPKQGQQKQAPSSEIVHHNTSKHESSMLCSRRGASRLTNFTLQFPPRTLASVPQHSQAPSSPTLKANVVASAKLTSAPAQRRNPGHWPPKLLRAKQATLRTGGGDAALLPAAGRSAEFGLLQNVGGRPRPGVNASAAGRRLLLLGAAQLLAPLQNVLIQLLAVVLNGVLHARNSRIGSRYSTKSVKTFYGAICLAAV